MSAIRKVAIIGAGPSGLVTAKTLLNHASNASHAYQITIFDKQSEVGGLWAVRNDESRRYEGMLNPEMPTNLSRFNIGFSDWAWEGGRIFKPGEIDDGGSNGAHVPFWPKAWMVGEYLRGYAREYLDTKEDLTWRLGTSVREVKEPEGEKGRWNVKWESVTQGGADGEHTEDFDYVVTASGFFSASTPPSRMLRTSSPLDVKTIHSTQYRQLSDISNESWSKSSAEGTILVVGGGMSGADVATVIASQLSNARYAPKPDKRYENIRLVQLCPEPSYALPLAAPHGDGETAGPTFVPLDIKMYDLTKRPPGDVQMGVGKWPKEVIDAVHSAFKGIVGDQRDLGLNGFVYDEELVKRTTYVTLTEGYASYVRSKDIDVRIGRLQSIESSNKAGKARATFTPNSQSTDAETIDNILGVVYATGFTPQPALSFLSPSLKETLQHDPNHNRLPILLSEHATTHNTLPTLAVIGFHEGAFWGSMEMEARLIAQKWAASTTSSPNTNPQSTSPGHDNASLLALRASMNEREPNVPQYWMGDYTGLMEVLARETSTTRHDLSFLPRCGPVTVARYTAATDSQTEADKSLAEFQQVYDSALNGTKFLGRATFLALQGNWKLSRTITSALASMPGGTFAGTARWSPRRPTADGYDNEFVYDEQGILTMNNGLVVQARKRYVWRYEEASDRVSVWFVKERDNGEVDYRYHDVVFDVKEKEERRKKEGWRATADHLCVEDMYESEYRFKFKGANLGEVNVVHVVKGPRKDYVSETRYVR